MKKSLYLICGIAFLGSIIPTACTKDKLVNQAPACSIKNIDNAEGIQQGTIITISVEASDADGYITEIQLYKDGTSIDTISSLPYNYVWYTGIENAGIHTILAIAKDNSGGSTSDEIIISLTARGETGTLTDYDGNKYITVKIGNQWWMAENLKVTKFPNGTAIPLVSDNSEWANLDDNDTDKAYCYNNNNANGEKDIYGALYTYAAAINACPTGWYLPSDEEWIIMESFVANDAHSGAEGTALKATSGWNNGGNGTDNYGFKALPGGLRHSLDGTMNNGGFGFWWCSYEWSNSQSKCHRMASDTSNIYWDNAAKSYGLSVRCIKDTASQ